MPRYFKLVCLHDDPQWYLEEFRQGRARYGWSGPGSNLRSIKARIDAGEWKNRTDDEVQAWSYTQFLIGEVIPPGYEFSPGDLDDFNHVLHITPITREAIPINSKAVTATLKHDLSKRGHYYEIYPEDSIREPQRWKNTGAADGVASHDAAAAVNAA